MKNHALILIWKGEDLPDYLVQKLAEVLVVNQVCIPEMLTMQYKDEDGIANALLRDMNLKDDSKQQNQDEEAIKAAVTYIGKRFENSLCGNNGRVGNVANITMFAIDLSHAVTAAKRDYISNDNKLLTAIEIIATSKAVIPASLARKYHFTQSVVDVITKVYQQQC